MKIKQKALMDIRKHCRMTPKLESCGYLFGEDNHIKSITKGKNLDKSSVYYTIDPDSTFRSVFRDDFKGVYHSHIGEAIPSSIDESKKKYPDKYYLIYSVSRDTLRAYFWNGKKFIEEEIEIAED